MSAAMTKRERVEAALNLQETDRIPVYYILLNDAVIEHFTGQRPPLGEEGLKLKLQATARTLDMTRMAGAAPSPPREWEDADGFVHYQEDPWMGGGLRRRPFSDEVGVREWCSRPPDAPRNRLALANTPRPGGQVGTRFAAIWATTPWSCTARPARDSTRIRGNLGLEPFSYLQADEPSADLRVPGSRHGARAGADSCYRRRRALPVRADLRRPRHEGAPAALTRLAA